MHAGLAFEVRFARPTDTPALAEVYSASILALGDIYYSPEQVAAWASFPDDIEAFSNWIAAATTLVAVESTGMCMGFGGLEAPARVSALFVRPERMRRGVGSAMLERLIAMAHSRACGVRELTTQASEFSKPLFEKFGFTVDYVERTSFKNVAFERYVMHRPAIYNGNSL